MPESARLVKAPQTRRGRGLSMVHYAEGARWGLEDAYVYVKTQVNYHCRPATRGWRATPTFAWEKQVLMVCDDLGLNTPRVRAYRCVDGVTELVISDIPAAEDLPDFYNASTPQRVDAVLRDLGHLVGIFHDAGWTHGSIAGAHVLVQPHDRDRVWLIDFEKAQRGVREGNYIRDLRRFFRRSPYLHAGAVDAFMHNYGSARRLSASTVARLARTFKRYLQAPMAQIEVAEVNG